MAHGERSASLRVPLLDRNGHSDREETAEAEQRGQSLPGHTG